MKEMYNAAEVELIRFSSEDIITASDYSKGENEGDEF